VSHLRRGRSEHRGLSGRRKRRFRSLQQHTALEGSYETLNSALADGSVMNGASLDLAIRPDLGKIIATLPPDSPDAQAELAALIPVMRSHSRRALAVANSCR
jgi:hypothetical protein